MYTLRFAHRVIKQLELQESACEVGIPLETRHRFVIIFTLSLAMATAFAECGHTASAVSLPEQTYNNIVKDTIIIKLNYTSRTTNAKAIQHGRLALSTQY